MDSLTDPTGVSAPASAPPPGSQLEPGPLPAAGIDPAGMAELERSVQALRKLFQLTLVALVLVIGAGSLVLLQRVRQVRRELAALSRTVSEFDRVGQPQLEAFLNRLKDFARTNPDFMPIFNRYVPPTTNAPGGSAVSDAWPPPADAPAKAPRAPAGR